MSLRSLFQFGKRLLKGKKESAQPATGTQQKQITYQPKPSQAQGQELATQEIKNPPIVLKKTKKGAVPIWIKTGKTDLNYVEVKEGIKSKETVYVLPSEGLIKYQQKFSERVKNRFG